MALTLQDARIHLEGRLEAVERLTLRLEQACVELAGPAPRAVREAFEAETSPEALRAELAVERLAARAPVLGPVLDRYRRASDAFAAVLQARAALLGLGELSPSAAIEIIDAEPLLFSGYLVPRNILVAAVPAAVLTAVAATQQNPVPLFATCCFLLLLALVFLPFSVQVSVTPKRLVIGSEVFPLAAVRTVRRSAWSTPRPYIVELVTEGRSLKRYLPDVPKQLEDALRAAGVPLALWRWF